MEPNDKTAFDAPQKAGTHSGIFHADEVFACAAMRLLNPHIEIIRTRTAGTLDNLKGDSDAILIDVGGEYDPARGLYDHHQRDGAGCRDLGTPYSSLGLIWMHYGRNVVRKVCQSSVIQLNDQQVDSIWNTLDAGLISAIDAVDCQGMHIFDCVADSVFTVSQVISGLNDSGTHAFYDALNMASGILVRELTYATSKVLKEEELRGIMKSQSGSPILCMPTFMAGWGEVVRGSDFQRVVFQDVTGSWRVQIAPDTHLLPESWSGLSGDDLDAATGIVGCLFCHRGRFIAGHTTQAGALKMAETSLDTLKG